MNINKFIYSKLHRILSRSCFCQAQSQLQLGWTEFSLSVHFSSHPPPHPTEIVRITPSRKLKFGYIVPKLKKYEAKKLNIYAHPSPGEGATFLGSKPKNNPPHPTKIVRITPSRKMKFGMIGTLYPN